MQECLWAIGSNGGIAAELGTYRMTVGMAGGLLRFLIHDCRHSDVRGCRPQLVASGTRPNIPAAIAAAEALATRLRASYGKKEQEPKKAAIPAAEAGLRRQEATLDNILSDWARLELPVDEKRRQRAPIEASKCFSLSMHRGPEGKVSNDDNVLSLG